MVLKATLKTLINLSLLNMLLKTMTQISTIILASFEKCCCHHRMTSSGRDIDCMYTVYDKHKFKTTKTQGFPSV